MKTQAIMKKPLRKEIMFNKVKEPTKLDNEIDRAMSKLGRLEMDSKEYAETLKVVNVLIGMREQEKPDRVSPDTMAIVAANLVGIFLIIKHEHVNVITSKALSLVIRPK